MTKNIGAREARNNFADLIGQVYYGNEVVIVERSGKPMVAMISIETYERFLTERETRFQVIDRIRERLPDLPAEEVEQDIAEALSAARASK
jgi:prevent-host-death family protein